MGKSWKNPGKLANSQKKGMQFTKLAREIQVAARAGANPEANSRLKLAIQMAQKMSCPKSTIERALQKGSGASEESQIEEVFYEAQAPHNVAIIVLCQTNNRNRTVSEIKNIFRKHNAQVVTPKSLLWLFDRVGLIEATKDGDMDIEEEAIEAGANHVEQKEDVTYFYTDLEDLDSVREALTKRGWSIETCEPAYKEKEEISLEENLKQEIYSLLEELDDNEDSHRIYTNLKD